MSAVHIYPINYHSTAPIYRAPSEAAYREELSNKVNTWVYKAACESIRIRNLLNNGLYSILDREIRSATAILEEGRLLSTLSQDPRIAVYLENLPVKIEEVRQSCAAHSQEIKKDAKLEVKWFKLKLPMSILEDHADCARFLVKSGLIFSIVGYRETSQNPHMHDVKLANDGHPLIKVQGQWTRWEDLKNRLRFDEDNLEILSTEGEDQRIQKWNYFHEQGLVPVDRFHYDHVFPIYELPQPEYDRLVQHAGRFYHAENAHLDPDPHSEKPCIVQFFTSPRYTHSSIGGSNLHRNIPVHVGIRLITADRKVYSFGLQMPESEQRTVNSNFSPAGMLSTFLMTATANISMLDYEEFREHEGRMVTSMPMTAERAQHLLARLNQLNARDQLRFNFGHQNCTSLMLETMNEAGYNEVNVSTPAWEVIGEALNPLQLVYAIPVIGPVIHKIKSCMNRIWDTIVSWTPQCIKTVFSWLDYIVFFIPRMIGTVVFSLFMLKLGGTKATTPMAASLHEEDLNRKGIKNFSTIIRSWKDYFKMSTVMVNHSKGFLDWQRKQRSTYTHNYQGRPSLCIVPPAPPMRVIHA